MLRTIGFLAVVGSIAGWWIATAPPDSIEIAPPYDDLTWDGPAEVREKATANDWIAEQLVTLGRDLPGYDEVVPLEEEGFALATGMDGWVWRVDLETGAARRFADPPLAAAGARRDPANPDRVYLCSARIFGGTGESDEAPGVYRLGVDDASIETVALRVPRPPPRDPRGRGVVYPPGRGPTLAFDQMSERNSRPIAFCNDLDVSLDGKRIYFSEPYAYEGASMGQGAFGEAIALGRHGRLWMVDLERRSASLVAQNYTFVDGVLLEYGDGERETAVLVTETVKFGIRRLHLAGPRAGQDDPLWQSLPGLPDGLDRDASGRVWVGMVKRRTPVVTWIHRHPWVKAFVLRLPHALLPVPHETGIMALSPDAGRVLFYTEHSGEKIRDISVVAPGRDRLYPATFQEQQRGFHTLPYP